MKLIENLHVLIMAGGSGSRFWPRSRRALPKQFLALAGEKTLLEETVERTAQICPRENVWVLTRADLAERTQEVLPWLDPTRLIAEPEGRDTAPCLVYASARVERVCPDATLLVLPADHVIPDSVLFAQTVRGAFESLDHADGLVTFGIRPDHPATGYGYIQRRAEEGVKAGPCMCYGVEKFREKPNLATAKDYVADGSFSWNAGIFLWRLSTFRESLEKADPELAAGWDALRNLGARLEDTNDSETRAAFGALRKISIDFALLEKADNVRVVLAEFSWDDVGSWQAVRRYRTSDDGGNIAEGRVVLDDCEDCTVFAADGRVVAGIGLSDLVIVDTPEALLVCPRDRVEEVKKLVARIEERRWEEVL